MNKLLEALRNAGIPFPKQSTESFRIVRWGKNNRYWLRKFEGGYVFGDFVTGLNSYVFDKEYKGTKLQEVREKMHDTLEKVDLESRKIHDMAATKAKFIWDSSRSIDLQDDSQGTQVDQPYLKSKKVGSHGIREYKGNLVVPAYDQDGKLWTLQFITANGEKRFLAGGRKKGCFFTIGLLDNAAKIFICEGYATGATIYECTDKKPVVVAFDANGLKSVSQVISKKVPNAKIIICADNDCYHENNFNPGVEKAREAALSIGAQIVIPKFKDSTTHPTDFNDLYILEGRDAVRAILENDSLEQSDIPSGFVLSNEGLFCVDIKGNTTRISNYIKVIAFTRSNDGISKLLEFRDYKNEIRRTVVKPKMLAKDGDAIRIHLVSHGFVYSGTSLSKRKLFEYISSSVPQKETILLSRTGFFEDVYIRSDRVIGKAKDGVILDDSVNDESVASAGTLQQWNDLVARWCTGNSRLIFAISSAFASILLKPCGIANFGFHFVGNSSSGKTTCLNVAASVFGNPKYVVTWKATDNALESIAFKRNDALLILDELSEISPSKAGEVAICCCSENHRDEVEWPQIFQCWRRLMTELMREVFIPIKIVKRGSAKSKVVHSTEPRKNLNKPLIRGLAKAYKWETEITNFGRADWYINKNKLSKAYVRRVLKLNNLSPKIKRAIMNGEFPVEIWTNLRRKSCFQILKQGKSTWLWSIKSIDFHDLYLILRKSLSFLRNTMSVLYP